MMPRRIAERVCNLSHKPVCFVSRYDVTTIASPTRYLYLSISGLGQWEHSRSRVRGDKVC